MATFNSRFEPVSFPQIRTSVEIPIEIGPGVVLNTVVHSFSGLNDSLEHLAIVAGKINTEESTIVRIHSECLTGDVFGSLRCDCGAQLREGLQLLAAEGGIVLYMRHEGRGIGLYRKLDAYVLQDQGINTFAANRCLGLPADARDYRASAEMLSAIGVRNVRLLSNSPDKALQLHRYGISVVQQIPTGVFLTSANLQYMKAKVDISGHSIQLPEHAKL
jgi:GTP cyclohydrolase II